MIRLILTLVLSYGWSLKQLDASDVFLHRDSQEKVFLTQLLGFEETNRPKYFYHLHKALYGLK